LGKGGEQRRSAEQRDLRQRRDERAFLFDKDLSRCLGEVDREEWGIQLVGQLLYVAARALPRAASDALRGTLHG
jgi:hypothetical protein